MKTGLLILKRNLYKQLLSVFSLSALLFVFEACYGTPQGFNNDVMISGNIRSADSQNPIEGILVTAENNNSYTYSDAEGNFQLFSFPDNYFTINITDTDSTLNGSFMPKDTVVQYNGGDEIILNISLEEKNGK